MEPKFAIGDKVLLRLSAVTTTKPYIVTKVVVARLQNEENGYFLDNQHTYWTESELVVYPEKTPLEIPTEETSKEVYLLKIDDGEGYKTEEFDSIEEIRQFYTNNGGYPNVKYEIYKKIAELKVSVIVDYK